MTKKPLIILIGIVSILSIVLGACGSSDETGSDDDTGGPATILVPQDHKTIQAAVDAASPGDLVLVDEGVYNEAVNVTTDDLTIRGVDRNKVILDGEFEKENGIRVLEANGVAIENMTARNYTFNGFYWTGADGYRGSYLTAYRNGDYGIYAFDSYNGQLDNSIGSGSPDAGFYIGQCYPCNAVVDNVVAEYNGLGYSGTNSGGDLYIINSTFRYNRAGIVPNSGSYELCYPSRNSTIVGNLVYDNNGYENPGISVSLLAQGNGILAAGATRTSIERNRVWKHERTGIGLVPFPEEDANALAPAHSAWDIPCQETRDDEVPPISEEDCKSVEGLLEGCVVLWNPFDNIVKGNVIDESDEADLAIGTVDLLGTGETTENLGARFCDNTFTTSAPAEIETLAPCEGSGTGDWSNNELNLLGLMGNPAPKPPADSYHHTPEPEPQENMPDARTAPPAGGFKGPAKPDIASIVVPERPDGV